MVEGQSRYSQRVLLAPATSTVALSCACAGSLEYPHAKPPVILGVGALGQILEVAEVVKDVKKDDIVLCDPYVGFSTNNGRYDYILQGWAALSPEGFKSKRFQLQ